MKEQKTAKEILKKHYDIMCDEDQDDWIPFEENVNSIDCMLAAMEEYSDQQNAELREKLASEVESREHWQRQTQRYQKYHRELNAALERVKELETLMQEFVDRVDRGEVRSKRTYSKFKGALKK